MFTSKYELERELTDAGIGPTDARALADVAAPGAWLRTTSVDEDTIPIGATKLGGRPDLPSMADWPSRPAYPNSDKRTQFLKKALTDPNPWPWATPDKRARIRKDTIEHIAIIESPMPLHFLAQINFAEAAGMLDPDMPTRGLLSIFYDIIEQPWGFDPQERMASAFAFCDGEPLIRRDPPVALTRLEDYQLRPLACELTPCFTPIAAGSMAFKALGLADACGDALHAWWHTDDNMYATEGGVDWRCHRIGGWPNAIQGDMQVQCALVAAGHYCGDAKAYRDPELEHVRESGRDWVLIAQIGTDEKGGLGWGDNGQVYVWLRRDDLKARRFERARLILQCY